MLTRLGLLLALLGANLHNLGASPLPATTAVHTKPDAGSPAITYLKAGSEPTPAAGASAPDGWMPIQLPGPFEGYVENRDLTKALDVKPGVNIRLAPRADAGVLAVAEKDEKATITGLRGKWTQISLARPLIGYIPLASSGPTPPPVTSGVSPAPQVPAPAVYGVATPGQAAPTVDHGDSGSRLPRHFVGILVSTRRPLAPRRPYDYALTDVTGRRAAYLDLANLSLPQPIEAYVGQEVTVFGAPRSSADGRDIVIAVDSLQRK